MEEEVEAATGSWAAVKERERASAARGWWRRRRREGQEKPPPRRVGGQIRRASGSQPDGDRSTSSLSSPPSDKRIRGRGRDAILSATPVSSLSLVSGYIRVSGMRPIFSESHLREPAIFLRSPGDDGESRV